MRMLTVHPTPCPDGRGCACPGGGVMVWENAGGARTVLDIRIRTHAFTRVWSSRLLDGLPLHYTVGLTGYGLPELVVHADVPPAVAAGALDAAADRVLDNEPAEPGGMLPGVDGPMALDDFDASALAAVCARYGPGTARAVRLSWALALVG